MKLKILKTPKEVERSPEEGDCKLLCCVPSFLQCCNNAKGFLIVYCIFAVVTGCMIGGVTNTNIAALERRFGMDSSESAFIVVSYDIAFCIITIFVTYFGAQSHIPRLISVGAALFGLGALVYAMPHFLTSLYDYGDDVLSDFCEANSTICNPTTKIDMRYNMYVLLLGQLLMGFGATPLYTLGLAYLEDSVAKDKAPIYLGIANACSLLGPVIGFTCGGSFLTYFYVDFDEVDADSLGFGTSDPRWVGAWWIAPLVVMVLCWATVIPFLGFPKQLPGTAKNRSERVSEVHAANDADSVKALASQISIKNIPKTVLVLLKNPVFVLMVIAGCISGGTVAGATSFLAKFIENEFHVTAGNAAIVAGATLVPAAATGHLAAGFIVSKFKWKTPQIIAYTIVCCLISAGLSPALLVRCESIAVAGVTSNYRIGLPLTETNMTSSCNSKCECHQEFYVPSCGNDGLTYFSPCHAGCSTENVNNVTGSKTYSNCSCVKQNLNASVTSLATTEPGYCKEDCSKIKLFLPLLFLLTFFIFQSHTTATVIAFRIVPESLRAFAVGLAWLFFRALGTIPGPIMFGRFIDSTCILWQFHRCSDGRGSCWAYDSSTMSITFMVLALSGNVLTGVLYGITWFVYKPPPESAAESEECVNSTTKVEAHDNQAYYRATDER